MHIIPREPDAINENLAVKEFLVLTTLTVLIMKFLGLSTGSLHSLCEKVDVVEYWH